MKTIFLKSTLGKLNMENLFSYYEENLKGKYKKEIKVLYPKSFSEKSISLRRFISKIYRHIVKYDLVIGDYFNEAVFRQGKKKIYVFHGALTKIQPSFEQLKDPKMLKHFERFRSYTDYIVSMTKNDGENFLNSKELQHIAKPEFIPLGLPRNDQLFDTEFTEKQQKYIKEKYQISERKVLLYAPTFRRYNCENIVSFNKNDFKKLNTFLYENNWVMIYRPHYISDIYPKNFFKDFKSIIVMGQDVEKDTQKILATTDFLLTDYSSIFVDFLIYNRPIAFNVFDLEKYKTETGTILDFENPSKIPGKQIQNINELIDLISEINNNKDSYKKHREDTIKYYFEYFDNNSCKRIWEFVINKVLSSDIQK